jgi:geranylgeranyl pyrophosphate synthase
MKLKTYIEKITKTFEKDGTINKTINLIKKMVEKKTPRIHAISADRNEFERNKTLLVPFTLNKKKYIIVL